LTTKDKSRPQKGRGKVFKLLFASFLLCGEAHEGVLNVMFKCPRMGKVSKHIPESLGAGRRGQLPARDRGNGLKAQPVVYRWTSRAGWLKATSYEVMKMKAVNHKPMNCPKGTLALQGGRRSEPEFR
jgi:putative transposase